MKKSVFILALLSVITLISACKKEPSITQGVYGTVIERYGDWMPGANADHGERPVACDVTFTSTPCSLTSAAVFPLIILLTQCQNRLWPRPHQTPKASTKSILLLALTRYFYCITGN